MKSRKNHLESGFSLIEIIISLVVVAVVAAMMTAYFGKGITESSAPIFRLNAAGKLNAIMEKITADYETRPRWSPSTTYAANTIIIPTAGKRNGYMYIASSGTSATTEPAWTISGAVPVDGSVTWTNNGLAPTLITLQTQIGAAGGEYTGKTFAGDNTVKYRVVQNSFIKFDAAKTEVPALVGDSEYGKYLKVTIGLHSTESPRTDETLTTLFVLR